MGSLIKIGTRGSQMALFQAEVVKNAIKRETPSLDLEIVIIKSEGDINQGNLAMAGGKGLFVSALDKALERRQVDMAVNCLKDIPNELQRQSSVVIAGTLKRDEIVDTVIARNPGQKLADLPPGSKIGTSAPRRTAFLKKSYPFLSIEYFRGSADMRIRKMEEGQVDAVILALAGLKRIGAESRICQILDETVMPPAVGAGIVTMDCLPDNGPIRELIHKISDSPTFACMRCERAMLRMLNGGCHSAIAGHAKIDRQGVMWLDGWVAAPDGSSVLHVRRTLKDPESLGVQVGEELVALGARQYLEK